MSKHDKIAMRLAMILNKLNSGESFRVEELAEEFNVTKRTVQRDINERLSFLPMKSEHSRYFLEEYYLGKLNFDDIQSFAVLSGIKELFPSLEENFLKKLLDSTVSQAYLVQGHNYEDLSNKKELFELIEQAVLQHICVSFDYKEKIRTINPYKLLNKKGIWYIAAVEDGVLKTFTLSKIKDIRLLDKAFKINRNVLEQIRKDDGWFSDNKIEVILNVNSDVAEYFKRRKIIPFQTIIKELSDGGLLVSTKVAYEEEALKLVRYWIPNIRIVSPDYLQEKLESGLEYYLAK